MKVKSATVIRKRRMLPIAGDVLVRNGDEVSFDTVVARTMIPGAPEVIDLSTVLNINADDIMVYMKKKEGDHVKENEVLGSTSFFGFFRNYCRSPIDGVVERISKTTGKVIVRGTPIPLELKAYIPGRVSEVLPNYGVTIETPAAIVQGIFGMGGETHGELMMLASSPDEVFTADDINTECAGKILVGGAMAEIAAVREAANIGARGVIVGGVDSSEICDILGQEIGVAITGQEEIGLTLIITEGFGKMTMAHNTFKLLMSLSGKQAAINGATQIRAGVIRPEIVVPRPDLDPTVMEKEGKAEGFSKGMEPGMAVRIIREPYFGNLGRVASLPIELQKTESESHVRVVEVQLDDGRVVVVPRANVEIIEE